MRERRSIPGVRPHQGERIVTVHRFSLKRRIPGPREALVFLLSVLAGIAILSGVAMRVIPAVDRWIVENLASIKGLPLDHLIYGIPRSVLWEGQVRSLGEKIVLGGLALVVCVLMIGGRPELRTRLTRCLVFAATFVLVFVFRNALELPFSNPLDVVGPLTFLRQNPLNDTLRYLLLILLPGAAVVLLDIFWFGPRGRLGDPLLSSGESPERRPPVRGSVIAGIAAWGLLAIVGGATYTWHSQVPLDGFHEGESLGPAVQWEHGQAPYRDVIVIHGAFQDPLRSIAGFALFGRSIAASRTMESLLQIIAHCLFAITIFSIFGRELESGALAAALLCIFLVAKPGDVGFDIPHRDILLFLFLLCIFSLYRNVRHPSAGRSPIHTPMLLFLAGLFPVAAFAYSIDRGYFLTVGGMLSVGLLLTVFVRQRVLSHALALIAGMIVGIACIGCAIRWEFPAFLLYTFGVMPKIHDLGWGLPFQFQRASGLVPVILTAFNASWLAHRCAKESVSAGSWRIGIRKTVEDNFVALVLLMMSVLFFRSALGRASESHTYYSSGLTFLLTSVILVRFVGKEMLRRASSIVRHGGGLVATVVVAGVTVWLLPHIDLRTLYRFPLGAPDEEALPPGYRPAMAFLRDSLASDETFLTLTSEGVWYYLLDKPSPTRFTVAMYAMTLPYQREFVREIEEGHVDYILMKSSFEPVDGIPFETRLPLVAAYVQNAYEPFRKLEDQEIWRRKNTTHRGSRAY